MLVHKVDDKVVSKLLVAQTIIFVSQIEEKIIISNRNRDHLTKPFSVIYLFI